MIERLWIAPLVTIALALVPVPFLDDRYRIFPAPVVAGCVVAGLLLAVATAIARSDRTKRIALGASVVLMLVLDVLAFLALFRIIFAAGKGLEGGPLLLSAGACWLANVATFALVYWYLNEALRSVVDAPGLLFPESGDAATRHTILDYIYLAGTTALAFGPTDTPPANTQMRFAMLIQALIAFIIVALVAARAVNAIQ